MNSRLRALIRTFLVYVPGLQEIKPALQRAYFNAFRIPFEHEFEALRLFPKIKDAVYLDVGGNRGFAIDAILMFQRSCRVLSFEPNPLLAHKIREQFTKNKRVEAHSCGLGDEDGVFTLFLPVYRGYFFYGLASFDRNQASSWLSDGQLYGYDAKHLDIRSITCEVKRLDSFNVNPFFIKLDVQGYELAVLRGGEDTLRRSTPIILIESVKESHMDFLKQFGYVPYRYDRSRKILVPGEMGEINTFLLTGDKARMLMKAKGRSASLRDI